MVKIHASDLIILIGCISWYVYMVNEKVNLSASSSGDCTYTHVYSVRKSEKVTI